MQTRMQLQALHEKAQTLAPHSMPHYQVMDDIARLSNLQTRLQSKRSLILRTKRALEPLKDFPRPDPFAQDIPPRDLTTFFKPRDDANAALHAFVHYFRIHPANEKTMNTALTMVLPPHAQNDWFRLRKHGTSYQDAFATLAQIHMRERTPQDCQMDLISLKWDKSVPFRQIMGKWDSPFYEKSEIANSPVTFQMKEQERMQTILQLVPKQWVPMLLTSQMREQEKGRQITSEDMVKLVDAMWQSEQAKSGTTTTALQPFQVNELALHDPELAEAEAIVVNAMRAVERGRSRLPSSSATSLRSKSREASVERQRKYRENLLAAARSIKNMNAPSSSQPAASSSSSSSSQNVTSSSSTGQQPRTSSWPGSQSRSGSNSGKDKTSSHSTGSGSGQNRSQSRGRSQSPLYNIRYPSRSNSQSGGSSSGQNRSLPVIRLPYNPAGYNFKERKSAKPGYQEYISLRVDIPTSSTKSKSSN